MTINVGKERTVLPEKNGSNIYGSFRLLQFMVQPLQFPPQEGPRFFMDRKARTMAATMTLGQLLPSPNTGQKEPTIAISRVAKATLPIQEESQ